MPVHPGFSDCWGGSRSDSVAAARSGRRPGSASSFFSRIDEDIDLDTWKTIAVEWLRGINSAIDDAVIGRSSTEGHSWAWQTKAWSGGEREPRAVLYQAVVVSGSEPGVAMGGTHVDSNDVLAADFGQWDLDRSR